MSSIILHDVKATIPYKHRLVNSRTVNVLQATIDKKLNTTRTASLKDGVSKTLRGEARTTVAVHGFLSAANVPIGASAVKFI